MVWLGAMLAAMTQVMAAGPQVSPGPLRQVSADSPFVDCTADNIPGQTGTVYIGSEVEPWIDVNPVDPDHMVGTWQQDRWSDGAARGLVTAVSMDGGTTWETVIIPGLTPCSGGAFSRASDPWLSFGPDGSLHHIALAILPVGSQPNAMLVNRSLDGGLTWSDPIRLITNIRPFFNDKESILADPTAANLVYAAWDRLDFSRGLGPAFFTRSTDNGVSWEAARSVHDPGLFNQVLGTQMLVLPDGRLLLFFTEIFNSGGELITFLSFKKSSDKGVTWTPPSPGAFRVLEARMQAARDPDLGLDVRDGALLFDVAVDPASGQLYAVWQDGAPTGGGWPVILLSTSRDFGATWSEPVQVNGTPATGPALNRQAFLPSVHVAGNGAIGVSYYDFRFNDEAEGALTDHWFTWCHPGAMDCTQASRWSREVRVTDVSFDLLQAPFAGGLFLGDYTGLSASGGDFMVFFTQTHDSDLSSAFFRRLTLEAVVAPEGAGFWSHQARVAVEGRGRAQEPAAVLLEELRDVGVLHDVFADVDTIPDLLAVLAQDRPASMDAQARRQVMALLLNLASGRLAPFAMVDGDRDVARAVDEMIETLADPAASRQELEAVKDLAEALNDGMLPL
jgi:hypothetical protein